MHFAQSCIPVINCSEKEIIRTELQKLTLLFSNNFPNMTPERTDSPIPNSRHWLSQHFCVGRDGSVIAFRALLHFGTLLICHNYMFSFILLFYYCFSHYPVFLLLFFLKKITFCNYIMSFKATTVLM